MKNKEELYREYSYNRGRMLLFFIVGTLAVVATLIALVVFAEELGDFAGAIITLAVIGLLSELMGYVCYRDVKKLKREIDKISNTELKKFKEEKKAEQRKNLKTDGKWFLILGILFLVAFVLYSCSDSSGSSSGSDTKKEWNEKDPNSWNEKDKQDAYEYWNDAKDYFYNK